MASRKRTDAKKEAPETPVTEGGDNFLAPDEFDEDQIVVSRDLSTVEFRGPGFAREKAMAEAEDERRKKAGLPRMTFSETMDFVHEDEDDEDEDRKPAEARDDAEGAELNEVFSGGGGDNFLPDDFDDDGSAIEASADGKTYEFVGDRYAKYREVLAAEDAARVAAGHPRMDFFEAMDFLKLTGVIPDPYASWTTPDKP